MSAAFQQSSLISRRMTIALAAPVLVLVMLGLVLGHQILQMAEDLRWVDHTHQVLSMSNETLLNVVEQDTSVRGYLLTHDRTFLESFYRQRPHEGFARLQTLSSDNPAQQAQFRKASQLHEAWLAAALPVIQGPDLEAAKSLPAILQRKARMDRVREAMRQAIEVEEGLRRARVAVSQASTAQAKILFVALLALAAALLALLSRRQLRSVAATFGAALEAETQARGEVESEAWIRAGHAKLVDALQGEQSLQQLGGRCLAVLAAHAGAEVGAFFVRDAGRWLRRAGYALDPRAAGPEHFAEGEGLIGSAAMDGRMVDLRQVPPEFLKLRSGIGEISPAGLVIVPARLEGMTHAVLELGFLRPPGTATLELLRRVGENIARAVQSAEYKQRLRMLLEESQRQAEELQTQQEELRVQNEELEQHSETLERQRDGLKRSQAELQRANAYKSEFLANMSHELRTPLNSSLILAKLLADNRQGNLQPEQVKFAQTIHSAGHDLLTLINDILELSKIEAGELTVQPETVSLEKLVDQLANTFQPIARQKLLRFTTQIDPEVPATMHTDGNRLQQILRNLLSNALKFTERGGVTLHVQRTADHTLSFAVQDTGMGISAEQHQLVFEAFKQADSTIHRKHGGTGLGLSISRDLARLLGGEITLQSLPGRGSTFTLRLPEHFDAQAEAPPSPRTALALSSSVPPSPPVNDDREQITATSRALLIVEDDAAFAHILHDLAHELGFQVLLAPNAAEGLAMATRYRPSAIVLDIGLPDRSGLSVLDALKHDADTRHIPVHVVSIADYTQTALEMGAVGYIIKPVERPRLLEALQHLAGKITQKVRRVLVVEDDEAHRDSTCRLLESDGVETVAVGTASAALQHLAASIFDCMVLDLALPDRSGFELLQEMSQLQSAFPPVVVYTGRVLSADEELQLQRFSRSIVIKGARSPERLLDEVTLFLHQVESELPPDRRRMLREARQREAVFEGRRILIVEDDVRNIFALSSLLEPKGATVEIARNGLEALAHLAAKPGVDLVLMDIMMPEMDGLEAMREIRQQPQHAKLPIIALTAKATAEDRENCLEAGANDYIAKPLDVDKLLSLARVWLPK